MNSKEKLAQALEEVRKNWTDNADNHSVENMIHLNKMIELAKEGYYSDYDSPIATPCMQLVKDLDQIGAYDVKTRAMNGEFDATEEESNEWYEREGKQMIEASGLPKELFETTHPLWPKRSREEREAKEGVKGWDY